MSDQRTPGPYWIRTSTNGKHQVCGRSGTTIREYPAHQMASADADCRKLQAGYTKAERAIREAAPELFEALKLAKSHIEHMAAWIGAHQAGYSFEALGEDMLSISAALAKATDQ